MEQEWKCTVCGLVRTSEERPFRCPLCGAEGIYFILPEQEASNLLRDLPATFRLHPVLAHFPSALVPTALILILFVGFGQGCLATAADFLLFLLLGVVPAVGASGLRSWKKSYRGAESPIFRKKMALALLLFLLLLIAAGARFERPDLLAEGGTRRWFYLGVLLAMQPVVVLLGHYGGKLAFQWRNKKD